MRTFSLFGGSLIAIFVAGLLVACDNPESRNPLSPSTPRITGVELIGPTTLAPGQSAAYSVRTRLSDGTQKTAAPNTVRWNYDSQFILIDASGLATAQEKTGDTLIRATVQGVNSPTSREVTIQPAGTFRVVGRVFDADSPSTPIPGARVEATPGPIVTTTDANGQYKLYGVSADPTIRVSLSGYANIEMNLQLTGNVLQDFRLSATGERLSLNGNYTLEIDASACTGSRPLQSSLRIRQYDAAVTTTGLDVTVVLTEPRFKKNRIGLGDRFTGRISGPRVTFTLRDIDYYYPYYGPEGYPDVVEELSDSSVYVPAGTVVAAGTPAQVSGIMGNFSFLSHWSSNYPNWPRNFLGSCSSSSSIRFTLSSR